MTVPSFTPQPRRSSLRRFAIVLITFAVIGPLLSGTLAVLGSWIVGGISEATIPWRRAKSFVALYSIAMAFPPGLIVGIFLGNFAAVGAPVRFFLTLLVGVIAHAIYIRVYTLPAGDPKIFTGALMTSLPVAVLATAACWFLTKDVLRS